MSERSSGAPSPAPHPGPAIVGGILLVVALGVIAPLALARHYGALGIPRSDDWSYLLTQFRWVDTGRLSFNHWVSMSLVGQLVASAPVAAIWDRSVTALQVFTAITGCIGLGATGYLVTRTTGRRGDGVFVAVTIAAGPLWGPLAASYMTDVPGFTACAVAMLVSVVALSGEPVRLRRLLLAGVVGLFAFSIRQYAIVIVAAVMLTGIWYFLSVGDRRRAQRALWVAVGAALAAGGFLLWWQTVPDVRSLAPSIPTVHTAGTSVIKTAGFLRLSGLLLFPVLLIAGPASIVRRSWRASRRLTCVIGSGALLTFVIASVRVPNETFVGNYIGRDGVLSDIVLIGHRTDVFPRVVWDVIVIAATVAALALAVALVPTLTTVRTRLTERDFRLRDPVGAYLGLVVTGYAAAYVGATLTGLQVYDRYLLPVLPAIAILILRAGRRAVADEPARPSSGMRRIGAGIGVAGLAVIGLAFTADSASFDGARWRAAVAATDAGWGPRQVNGGFEWVNYHRGRKLDVATLPPDRANQQRSLAGDPTLCVTVHVNPSVPRDRIVAVRISRAPTRSDERLVAYRIHSGCRPRGSRR